MKTQAYLYVPTLNGFSNVTSLTVTVAQKLKNIKMVFPKGTKGLLGYKFYIYRDLRQVSPITYSNKKTPVYIYGDDQILDFSVDFDLLPQDIIHLDAVYSETGSPETFDSKVFLELEV